MDTVANGIIREYLFNDRVVSFKIDKNLNAHMLFDWGKTVREELSKWNENNNYVAIHDLTKSGVSLPFLVLTGYNILDPWLTNENAYLFLEWLKNHPERKVRLALIVSSALSGQIAIGRARSSVPNHPQIDSQIFDERDVAIEWAKQSANVEGQP